MEYGLNAWLASLIAITLISVSTLVYRRTVLIKRQVWYGASGPQSDIETKIGFNTMIIHVILKPLLVTQLYCL
jgi:hypothetical protein